MSDHNMGEGEHSGGFCCIHIEDVVHVVHIGYLIKDISIPYNIVEVCVINYFPMKWSNNLRYTELFRKILIFVCFTLFLT